MTKKASKELKFFNQTQIIQVLNSTMLNTGWTNNSCD